MRYFQLACQLCLLLLLWEGVGFAQNLRNFDRAPLETLTTAHFNVDFHVGRTTRLVALVAELDKIYSYVSERMDVSYEPTVTVAILPLSTGSCPVRGVALLGDNTNELEWPNIVIFSNNSVSLSQLRGVAAHELGHLFHSYGFAKFPGSAGTAEGLATWAAGRYWLEWQEAPSFDAAVKGYLERGIYQSLENSASFEGVFAGGKDCLERRDVLYTQWGAFTAYLIDTYGVETFKRLLDTADIVPLREVNSLPDFERVYKKTLEQLETDWLAQL